MDLIQHARELYTAGRMHDALEAAQAACDRSPKDPEAWSLLGRVSRRAQPHRVSAERFRSLAQEAGAPQGVRVEPMPTEGQVRAGVDPDALTYRDPHTPDVLVLFQVNHENRSDSEDALRTLIGRSLAGG